MQSQTCSQPSAAGRFADVHEDRGWTIDPGLDQRDRVDYPCRIDATRSREASGDPLIKSVLSAWGLGDHVVDLRCRTLVATVCYAGVSVDPRFM